MLALLSHMEQYESAFLSVLDVSHQQIAYNIHAYMTLIHVFYLESYSGSYY